MSDVLRDFEDCGFWYMECVKRSDEKLLSKLKLNKQHQEVKMSDVLRDFEDCGFWYMECVKRSDEKLLSKLKLNKQHQEVKYNESNQSNR